MESTPFYFICLQGMHKVIFQNFGVIKQLKIALVTALFHKQ